MINPVMLGFLSEVLPPTNLPVPLLERVCNTSDARSCLRREYVFAVKMSQCILYWPSYWPRFVGSESINVIQIDPRPPQATPEESRQLLSVEVLY